MRDDPKWKLPAMKKFVVRDWMLDVSNMKLYRAHTKTIDLIEGDLKQQHAKLWDYCEAIRSYNDGSYALLSVDRPIPNDVGIFKRMFIMYNAQKRGTLAGVRPLIGLDVCHLKGSCGGQLLSAMAMDGNDQMFPLAIVVAEAECKDSQIWLLENLTTVIGSADDMGQTFISDRQKVS